MLYLNAAVWTPMPWASRLPNNLSGLPICLTFQFLHFKHLASSMPVLAAFVCNMRERWYVWAQDTFCHWKNNLIARNSSIHQAVRKTLHAFEKITFGKH